MHKLAIEFNVEQKVTRTIRMRYSIDMPTLDWMMKELERKNKKPELTAKELIDYLDGRGELATVVALTGSRRVVDNDLNALAKCAHSHYLDCGKELYMLEETIEQENIEHVGRAYIQHQP